MVSSFIITPDYFKSPESGEIVRESGIENRYNRALTLTDPNFSITKDDWSDGVIRYIKDNEIRFYGIQECKRLVKTNSLLERITQGLCYVYSWLNEYPQLKSKFRFLLLPTEKYIDVIYIDGLLNSVFWTEFCFYYSMHKAKKGTASNFYKKNTDVYALMHDYAERFEYSHREIGNNLDFKEVTEEILNNCL